MTSKTRTVDLSTHLEAPPEKVWEAVKHPSTLLYITKGLLGFSLIGDLPEGWAEGSWAEEGSSYTLRLKAFNVIPLWRHTIDIKKVDEHKRTIESQEHGGTVKGWRHRIFVEPEGEGTRYRDVITIDAGLSTPSVWAFAQGFYRYRHARWRRLARRL